MATEYTIGNARLALPHLVAQANVSETITYSELGHRIDRHWRAVRHLLFYIRDEICIPRGLPLLTAIVVNKSKGLPGESWLPGGTAHLSPEEYKQAYDAARDEVFAFDGWEALLEHLGLPRIRATEEDLNDEGRARAFYLERTGGVGEADVHRMLKQYVAEHPASIGLTSVEAVDQEYLFISGDRCDIVFDLGGDGDAVVEIKDQQRGELVRGIYQAVKYRALMEAEKGLGEGYPVSAHLVSQYMDDDIRALAKRFQVQCHTLPRGVADA